MYCSQYTITFIYVNLFLSVVTRMVKLLAERHQEALLQVLHATELVGKQSSFDSNIINNTKYLIFLTVLIK